MKTNGFFNSSTLPFKFAHWETVKKLCTFCRLMAAECPSLRGIFRDGAWKHSLGRKHNLQMEIDARRNPNSVIALKKIARK